MRLFSIVSCCFSYVFFYATRFVNGGYVRLDYVRVQKGHEMKNNTRRAVVFDLFQNTTHTILHGTFTAPLRLNGHRVIVKSIIFE